MRLRRSLALLVVAILVPVLAFSAIAVYQYGREQSAATEQALLDAARALGVALDKHFEATIAALRVMGTSEQLDAGDLAAFHRQCLRALGAREEWRSISLFDLTGRRLLITTEPFGTPLPGPPPAMTEPFRRLVETQAPNVSDLFRSPLTGRHGVSVGVPIVRGGAVRWVISAGMSPDALEKLLASQRVLPEWTGTILDRRHVIVADSRAQSPVGEPALPGFVEAATVSPEGTLRGPTKDGRSALTAFSRSRAFGWTASIAVPVAGGVFGDPVAATLSVGVVLLLIGAAVAVWVGRRISRPIEALAVAADRIGRGEPVEPVVSGVAEVAALSTALVGASRDRAHAEADLARYAERLRILHEIDQALIAAEAPVAIAEAALRRLRPLLGAPRAVVTLFDLAAGEGRWLAVDARGPTRLGPGARFPLEMMGDMEALRRGEVQMIDVLPLAHLPQAQALLAEGVPSFLVVPLIAGGELIGSLNLAVEAPGQLPAEQVSMAREVGVQLAIAIEQARLHERIYLEDNPSNLRLVERILRLRPAMKLLTAMQGRVGLELAREHRPDLILLDQHLPDVPGDEILRALRDDPRTRDIPVVMLSADASPGQIQRLLEAGARAYLTKPLDVTKLLAVLDEAMPRGAR